MPVSSSTEHWIKPDALTINLNHFGDPDYLQVSILAGAVVMAFKQDVIGYNAAHNYRTWTLDAASTYLETTSAYYVYARCTRSEVNASALVIYDPVMRDVEGREITYATDEETGEEVEVLGEADETYYFVFLGKISASVDESGSSVARAWEIEFRFGSLSTNQYQNEEAGGEWTKMFRLNKVTDMIEVLKTFSSAVFGKLSIKKGTTEKPITDIKRSTDGDNEYLLGEDGNPQTDGSGAPIKDESYVPISDETIATSLYVDKRVLEIENDKFLRKDQDDRTPFNLAVGGVFSAETSILFQEKQISGFIRYYDDPRPEVVTDVDFYSALMTDYRIKEEIKDLDDRYLRKDPSDLADTAQRPIRFERGITVYELAEMWNLQVNELATIARAIVDVLGSAKFVDGFFGEGYQIWKSIATEDWCFTIDRLTVRKVMTVFELIIQKIRAVGGMLVVSAGNGKVKEVTQEGLEYKFTFEDTNTFAENDLMRCQVWTGTGVKYYWVEVTRVDGENVYARVEDFGGVVPEEGDEVVLMGNTKNKLRQNLLLLSATEDGQPRFDCLDGVHTKNFEGCLRTRVGCLDGISDDQFPAGLQPQGYGLYADNCYLRGAFVLSTGVDVATQFAVLEGQIRAGLSSVQQQINEEDNYLSNASFTSSMEGWEYANDVKVFNTSGGLLHFNGEFYSDKRMFAGIVAEEGKNVLRLKNSHVMQRNADYASHPEFSLVEQTTTDEEGKEVGTGVLLYHPTMFYVSFKYMVARRGTLKVCFKDEETLEDFEDYTPISFERTLEAGSSFLVMDDIVGKWNGTGDFYLSFDGEIYIYDLALSSDALSDMEERWAMQLEITDKKIQANAEHIVKQGADLEAYRSEFLFTAEELRTTFTAEIKNLDEDLTAEYQGYVQQTAQSLTSDYTAKIGDYYGTVTEEYNSKIEQTAQSITTTLTARIDNTDKNLADTEAALIKDYEAKIKASADTLTSDYTAKITDLRTGDIATMQSSITQQANLIATKVSQTSFDALGQRVTTAESSITQQAGEIELKVSKNGVISSINQSSEAVTINASKINLTGKVTISMLATDALDKINSKADPSDITDKVDDLKDSLGDLAFESMIGKSKLDTTVIDGGYIVTTLINANALKISSGNVTGLGSLATKNSVSTSEVSGLGSLATYNSVLDAMNDETLIVGGYIKTSLINADEISTKKLTTKAGSDEYYVDINDGRIWMTDGTNVSIEMNSSSYVPSIWLYDSNNNRCGINSTGIYYTPASGGFISMAGNALNLNSGATIKGLAIGNIYSFANESTDFARVSTSSFTLPSASSSKGKVIFVKLLNSDDTTIKSADGIYKGTDTSTVTSYARRGRALFFISDGTYWYEFECFA